MSTTRAKSRKAQAAAGTFSADLNNQSSSNEITPANENNSPKIPLKISDGKTQNDVQEHAPTANSLAAGSGMAMQQQYVHPLWSQVPPFYENSSMNRFGNFTKEDMKSIVKDCIKDELNNQSQGLKQDLTHGIVKEGPSLSCHPPKPRYDGNARASGISDSPDAHLSTAARIVITSFGVDPNVEECLLKLINKKTANSAEIKALFSMAGELKAKELQNAVQKPSGKKKIRSRVRK